MSLGLTINFNILQSHLVVMQWPICWQQHIIRRQGGKSEKEERKGVKLHNNDDGVIIAWRWGQRPSSFSGGEDDKLGFPGRSLEEKDETIFAVKAQNLMYL